MSMILEPGLGREVRERFSDWNIRVAKRSPFREFCVPVMKKVIQAMNLPIIYHSDGNILPLMEISST